MGAAFTGAEPLQVSGGTLILSPKRVPLLRPEQGEPWLGVSVHKASTAVHASLSKVPEGVGFVIEDVVVEGPAAVAGMRKYDYLWKLNDQLVINEAQFLVLLHLHKAGDVVNLTFQRNGQNSEVPVTLRERPTHRKGRAKADVLVMSGPPMPGMKTQFLESLRQEASIKSVDGTLVRLMRKGTGYHWIHLKSTGELINNGDVADMDALSSPDNDISNPKLNTMLKVLIRVFEDAEKRAQGGERRARVRRVPTPKAK